MGIRNNRLIRRTHQYWHLVFFALLLAGIFALLRGIGGVLTPVAAALVLSYLLDPVVEWMQKRLRINRGWGTLVLFLVALLLLVVVILLVVPLMVRQIHTFVEAVPAYVQRIQEMAVPWVETTFGIDVPDSFNAISSRFGDNVKELGSKVLGPLGGVAKMTAGAFSWLATMLLVPIFTFYFLPNFDGIVCGAERLIPRRYVPTVRETAGEIDRVLAAWIRGQLTVVTILAILYSVGLSIVGVKMAVLIGTLTGCLAFIPYVGVAVGVITTVVVSLLEHQGFNLSQLAGAGVVFAVVQALEGMVLTPYLVGGKVGLGPVGVLLALMLFGNLFGFVGVLIAVPTAAALVVIIRRAMVAYRESHFYAQGGAVPECIPDDEASE
jgi:predicted PurR-regulated permease PerM